MCTAVAGLIWIKCCICWTALRRMLNETAATPSQHDVRSMDSFVINTLTDWQLTDLLESFKEEGIDEESFLLLDEATINQLIPRAGPRLKFLKKFRGLVR